MTSPTEPSPDAERRFSRRAAFTLIELILVMALLAIAASLAAPRMASFFRGRTLDQEARRLLSLTHYAQSRAIAEGYPVLLWVDTAASRYGLEIRSGYVASDDRAIAYDVDGDLSVESSASDAPEPYEDEGLSSRDLKAGIIFNPDGLIDPSSVSKIVIRQRDEAAIALRPMKHGLAYELDSTDEATRQ